MDEDLVRRRRTVEHERVRFGVDPSAVAVDGNLRDSWLRCAPERVSSRVASRRAAPLDEPGTVADRWRDSPIRRAFPGLTDQLHRACDDGDLVAAVSDEQGRILWTWGGRTMRNRAESVNFAEGGRWDEGSVGTNAMGLALITGKPASVFAGEHWWPAVHDWVCYSAPVRDPQGAVLGVIDLSAMWDRASPLGLTTVSALAQVVEHGLRLMTPAADGTAAEGGLEISALGRGSVALDGMPVLVTLRQLEILTVLACVGQASLGELHGLLHGDRVVSPSTTKAEISHLRRQLGGLIASRPYQLTVPVTLDLADVLDRLDRGDLAGAAQLYGGQLLARSDAPYVVERRHHCDVALRTALLRAGTTRDLLAFADVHPFDVEVLERALALAGPDDPQFATATARLAVALSDGP